MKIITWNIRHSVVNRIARISAQIATWQPDVLVLTEYRNHRVKEGLALVARQARSDHWVLSIT